MSTVEMAERIVNQRLDIIPENAIEEAKRGLLNWLGVAIGAASHPMLDMLLEVGRETGGFPQVSVLGRGIKTDSLTACLVNGVSSHIFDYDDTLLDTVLHPSAPVFPALMAYTEQHPVSPRDFLAAFVLGVEIEQRIAQAIYPSHYNRGWHITGSVGSFGAAAAVGRLMGLDTTHMVYALGLCATQPVGLREMFGTFTKPFHPGKAAANGYQAALLAAKGFTSSMKPLEALRGFLYVTSESPKLERLTEHWGECWEILANSYKPFPCGIVIHPSIDAACQLKQKYNPDPTLIDRVDLYVHPLVLELTGKKTPKDGLEAKFSVFHCAAAGLIDGFVGLRQFLDSRVVAQDVVALRGRCNATVDATIREDQVRAVVTMLSGERHEIRIDHCIGSKNNPMTKAHLETKFTDVTAGCLSDQRQRELMDYVWSFDKHGDIHKLISLSTADLNQ